MKFKFGLGDTVKDTITGFTGIIVTRSQWLNNCNTYGVQSQALKDGIPQERVWFDEPQMSLLKESQITLSQDTGGPTRTVPHLNRN